MYIACQTFHLFIFQIFISKGKTDTFDLLNFIQINIRRYALHALKKMEVTQTALLNPSQVHHDSHIRVCCQNLLQSLTEACNSHALYQPSLQAALQKVASPLSSHTNSIPSLNQGCKGVWLNHSLFALKKKLKFSRYFQTPPGIEHSQLSLWIIISFTFHLYVHWVHRKGIHRKRKIAASQTPNLVILSDLLAHI